MACSPRNNARHRSSTLPGRMRRADRAFPKAKNVVVIFCAGREPVETWDYKPELITWDDKPLPVDHVTFQAPEISRGRSMPSVSGQTGKWVSDMIPIS